MKISNPSLLDGYWFEARISKGVRVSLLVAATLLAVIATFSRPPIVQNPAYNHFSDQRMVFGIPNFYDVVSNLPLLLVGIAGIAIMLRQWARRLEANFVKHSEIMFYLLLYVGVLLAAFGSAYYHLAPSDNRLVWDRLPMTIIFMSFLAATIGERINLRIGLILLPVLLSLGVASIVYWHFSELEGVGDLRVYLDVQYFSTLAVPLIALLFPSRYTGGRVVYGIVAIYLLAKSFELLDAQVYSLGHLVSGHVIKHVLAALASYLILNMVQTRQSLAKRPRVGQ